MKWRSWLLPNDAIRIESKPLEDGFFAHLSGEILKGSESSYFGSMFRDDVNVWLLRIGVFRDGTLGNISCNFAFGYESKIMKVLLLMEETERNEVGLILNAGLRLNRVGKVFGIWFNEEDNNVYLVFEKFRSGSVNSLGELTDGFLGESRGEGKKFVYGGFGMLGMDICEVINDLHVEGFTIGCLGVKSFSFNQFGRVFVDLFNVLLTGSRVCRMMSEKDDWENTAADATVLNDCVFVSPEVIFALLRRNGLRLEDGSLRYNVNYGSDVWSLACLLIFLLVGNSFIATMHDYYEDIFTASFRQKCVPYVDLYTDWRDKIIIILEDRLGSELSSLKKILFECLSFNSESRPVLTAVWDCLKALLIKPEFDLGFHPKTNILREIPSNCLVLGSLCHILTKNERKKVNVIEEETGLSDVEVDDIKAEGNVIEAFSNSDVKCAELKGHFDCISGLAVGGGFLFSSSHDKSINVWSLQDFSFVHTFRGHEDRVTAVIFIDGGEPLCVSADKGGIICIWGARNPLNPSPMKKLFEPKDWRYSGIHALASSENHYLYTGSGDKTIKVWSLQDCSLINTITGHKSVVSALAVCDGVLYSGSWDGTVRLWSLGDHNALAVLGEDIPGNLSSVLSIAVEDDMLIVGHEDGSLKIWYNSMLVQSRNLHNGAVFSVCKAGSWLFSGGWDKTINVQEVPRDGFQVEALVTGSCSTNSVVTSLLYFQGKLFVGLADRLVKVFYFGV